MTPAKDHPRRCGENGSRHKVWDAYEGSPPQVRGKLHAGWGDSLFDKDHPRRCGENTIIELLPSEIRGSPPQVRGKLWMSIAALIVYGITPAGAGKTVGLLEDLAGAEDHPRRCGENLSQSNSGIGESGSPPQVRGKRRRISGHIKQ